MNFMEPITLNQLNELSARVGERSRRHLEAIEVVRELVAEGEERPTSKGQHPASNDGPVRNVGRKPRELREENPLTGRGSAVAVGKRGTKLRAVLGRCLAASPQPFTAVALRARFFAELDKAGLARPGANYVSSALSGMAAAGDLKIEGRVKGTKEHLYSTPSPRPSPPAGRGSAAQPGRKPNRVEQQYQALRATIKPGGTEPEPDDGPASETENEN